MQALNRFAALSQLFLHGQFAEGGVRLGGVAAYQHAPVAEQASGRKPDRAASDRDKLQTAVDVIVLLPEAPALPRNLVGARIGALIDQFFVWGAEVIWCRPKERQRHGADAVIRIDCLCRTLLLVAD